MARYWALAVFFIHFLEAIALSEQRFSAAAKPSHLDRRQSGFEPRHDGQVLYYLDGNTSSAFHVPSTDIARKSHGSYGVAGTQAANTDP